MHLTEFTSSQVRVGYGAIEEEAVKRSEGFTRKVLGSLVILGVTFTCLIAIAGFASRADTFSVELVGLGSSEEDANALNADFAIRQGGAEAPRNADVDPKYLDLLAQAECEQQIEVERAKAFVTGQAPTAPVSCAPKGNSTVVVVTDATTPAAA